MQMDVISDCYGQALIYGVPACPVHSVLLSGTLFYLRACPAGTLMKASLLNLKVKFFFFHCKFLFNCTQAHLFVYSFFILFSHSFIHSFILSFIQTIFYSFNHTFTQSIIQIFIHSFITHFVS